MSAAAGAAAAAAAEAQQASGPSSGTSTSFAVGDVVDVKAYGRAVVIEALQQEPGHRLYGRYRCACCGAFFLRAVRRFKQLCYFMSNCRNVRQCVEPVCMVAPLRSASAEFTAPLTFAPARPENGIDVTCNFVVIQRGISSNQLMLDPEIAGSSINRTAKPTGRGLRCCGAWLRPKSAW